MAICKTTPAQLLKRNANVAPWMIGGWIAILLAPTEFCSAAGDKICFKTKR